ncbi:hypothetical protein HK096_003717 [Nowakowskiella sp. JEL0078]|nr:hypothetical protein HK096_003717 [Nowakowskiella sp. JEL0078]
MGICLGTDNEGKTVSNTATPATRATNATSSNDRDVRAAAAEARLQANASKGIQGSGGKLSKQLEEQKKIVPGKVPVDEHTQKEQIVVSAQGLNTKEN